MKRGRKMMKQSRRIEIDGDQEGRGEKATLRAKEMKTEAMRMKVLVGEKAIKWLGTREVAED